MSLVEQGIFLQTRHLQNRCYLGKSSQLRLKETVFFCQQGFTIPRQRFARVFYNRSQCGIGKLKATFLPVAIMVREYAKRVGIAFKMGEVLPFGFVEMIRQGFSL